MATAEPPPTATYTCPMHPEVEQDRPGNCPKCGMELLPREEADAAKMPTHRGKGQEGHGEEGAMSADHREMVRQMRGPWLWTNFTVIALGAWLITSPFTFGYSNFEQIGQGVVRMTADRELASLAFRGAAMTWSDVISGLLLVLFGAYSLWPHPRNDFFGRWSVCLVGLWLQFAPLVFWAPSAAAYVNDTLVGVFAIALSILVPMMPGMAHHMAMMKPGPEVPPGWSYNPSSWHQRAPLIALGFLGWFISRYLAAVQLGYTPEAWEPFFGDGTQRVLHSDVSRMMPISDAGLGALAYTIEALMGFMGNTKRWRTMPWMVTFFGILVIPLGVTHIVLVILQPVAVGYWCTLCLAAALTMLVMIPLTVDEVVAMCQFMARAVREGKPFWRTFWVGDTVSGGGPDTRTPRYGAPAREMAPAMIWGVTLPWNLVASMAIGVWLMFSPAVFGTDGAAANSDHLVGAVVVMTAGIATAEVIRAARFLNTLLGMWVVAAPWLLGGFTVGAQWNGVAAGVALILLSLPRGTVRDHYGSWDRYIV
jgi:uncharacterized membrane protein